MASLTSTTEAAEFILKMAESLPNRELRIATPLGLGKPNILLNLIYRGFELNPSVRLRIYTALSLNPPQPSSDLAKRFLEPFKKRHWGEDYPELEYSHAALKNALPPNIRVHEFYFQAGSALQSESLQRDYQCLNYTHAADNLFELGIHVLVQLVARDMRSGKLRYSLSCNPDLTLDVVDLYRNQSKPLFVMGIIHPDLAFLGGEAEVDEHFFDSLVDAPAESHRLFALPKMLVHEKDHLIGFYASQLIADNGTLQIGIGSLSDAVVASLIVRQKQNDIYSNLVNSIWKDQPKPSSVSLHTGPFEQGLYGLSEMIMDGFMHLRRAGILKRLVQNADTEGESPVLQNKSEIYLHGAFFLGSNEFYSWLRSLSGEDFAGLRMGRVSQVNDLYDPNELALRLQRKNPRFLNTCMQVTLLGGAASDTREDGGVVSGVGGQYNFVAMSHELKNSRSILMLRSVREVKGRRHSNIVWTHGNLTIPRHLRDIVITEYGIADLKGKTDEETIRALLNITDSEFQEELVRIAKKNKKLALNYEIPDWAKNNTPEKVTAWISKKRQLSVFEKFPFGSDFTPEEENLAFALERLQNVAAGGARSKIKLASWFFESFKVKPAQFHAELARMSLQNPHGLKERVSRRLLLRALSMNEDCAPNILVKSIEA